MLGGATAQDADAGQGKRMHLRHLSPDCREVLENAKDMIEVNLLEDPRYHVADDRLG